MKVLNLDNYISEKKSIKPLTIKQSKDIVLPNYYPKTKDELKEIIFNRMKDEGNECDLNDIDVSNITDMSYLFSDFDENGKRIKNNLSEFNGDISEWNVSNVKNMNSMFYDAKSFNCDISRWNVSNVKDMSYMFYYAESFNSDISGWKVSEVKNMHGMFWGAKSFNGDISKWDVSNVKHMSHMFNYAENFNCDISGWNVSKVENKSCMFIDCPLKIYPEKQPKFNI